MINWDKVDNKKRKNILLILIGLLILILIPYIIIINNKIQKSAYVSQALEIVEKNEEAVFSVEKIYICNSANAVYSSSDASDKNLGIYQYSDIAVYLNNYQDENGLTNKNTVKELYIDNIEISIDENDGIQSLSYINSLEIGSKEIAPVYTQTDRIDFNIVYTNEDNGSANYDDPTFYTDCSNPITLRYINNLSTEYVLEDDTSSSFDGSILEDAGISVDEIACSIKFKINIVNNDGEEYSCWLNFSLPLSDIYEGTTIKTASFSGTAYNFFAL